MAQMKTHPVEGEAGQLELFSAAVLKATMCDFSEYSEKSLRRRVDRLLEEESCSFEELLERLDSDASYGEHVVNRITVNTSELFRDPAMWLCLRGQVLPLFRREQALRVWHAGCSRGQEVYSMLMLLNELGMMERTSVYASDLNSEVLADATRGTYRFRFNLQYLDNFDRVINTNPLNYEEVLDVPYSKYFAIDKEQDKIQIHDFLLSRPTFKRNNLLQMQNPFGGKYDIIFCRNVIIYFNRALQNRLFELFYNLLEPGGVLVLGMHESVVGVWADRFTRLSKVYVKREGVRCVGSR